MMDCWPTTGCEIISQKNYERLFRGWRRLFIGGLKERMHRNGQNGQLHALQREAGRLQRRSIEITVAVVMEPARDQSPQPHSGHH
jgi:hypothetical protein